MMTQGSDAALIAAEARAVSLIAWIAREQPDEMAAQAAELEEARLDRFIGATEPTTLAGAAAKLRRLLDPEIGLPTTHEPWMVESVRQVLELLEREAEETAPGASRAVPIGGGLFEGDKFIGDFGDQLHDELVLREADPA